MKEKLIERLYDFWKDYNEHYNLGNENLKERITQAINSGEKGAEELLDWCIGNYDNIREQYQMLHNLSDDEMEMTMEENSGGYEFMYGEIPFVEELEEIWDICNWYLDYTQGNSITEKDLLRLIEEY